LGSQNAGRQWILDADLAAAFDRIDHNFLLTAIGTFPAREQIRQWLKAGVVDRGRFSPTREGAVQGGVISPLLLNIVLQGTEEAAGVEYDSRGTVKAGRPTVITYADDFVALCHSREQAETVAARLDPWLAERGLTLNRDKTAIRHADDGFDFLSFTTRRYHPKGGRAKVLTRPSKEALRKIRRENAETMRALRGTNVAQVIRTMNPRIRGRANYFRNGASKEAFQSLDEHLWQLIYKWIRHSHPGRRWK
jgi:RNA-directed DNA polymerase